MSRRASSSSAHSATSTITTLRSARNSTSEFHLQDLFRRGEKEKTEKTEKTKEEGVRRKLSFLSLKKRQKSPAPPVPPLPPDMIASSPTRTMTDAGSPPSSASLAREFAIPPVSVSHSPVILPSFSPATTPTITPNGGRTRLRAKSLKLNATPSPPPNIPTILVSQDDENSPREQRRQMMEGGSIVRSSEETVNARRARTRSETGPRPTSIAVVERPAEESLMSFTHSRELTPPPSITHSPSMTDSPAPSPLIDTSQFPMPPANSSITIGTQGLGLANWNETVKTTHSLDTPPSSAKEPMPSPVMSDNTSFVTTTPSPLQSPIHRPKRRSSLGSIDNLFNISPASNSTKRSSLPSSPPPAIPLPTLPSFGSSSILPNIPTRLRSRSSTPSLTRSRPSSSRTSSPSRPSTPTPTAQTLQELAQVIATLTARFETQSREYERRIAELERTGEARDRELRGLRWLMSNTSTFADVKQEEPPMRGLRRSSSAPSTRDLSSASIPPVPSIGNSSSTSTNPLSSIPESPPPSSPTTPTVDTPTWPSSEELPHYEKARRRASYAAGDFSRAEDEMMMLNLEAQGRMPSISQVLGRRKKQRMEELIQSLEVDVEGDGGFL